MAKAQREVDRLSGQDAGIVAMPAAVSRWARAIRAGAR